MLKCSTSAMAQGGSSSRPILHNRKTGYCPDAFLGNGASCRYFVYREKTSLLLFSFPCNLFPSFHCTAMVTVLEVTPPMVRTTGTALPAGVPAGTTTFT